MGHNHRTWIEISSAAVRHNLTAIQQLIGPGVGILPIVKANAYGHGMSEITSILQRQRHAGVGVAYGEEALSIRANNYRGRIVVLSFWQPHELAELIRKNVELVVWDWASLTAVAEAARRSETKPKIHIKLDTGTHRIGFQETDLERLRRVVSTSPAIKVVGIFSHLANAEERSTTRTKKQVQYFTTLVPKIGLRSGVVRHLACTAAIIRYPEARFGLVRPGIGLYGLWPSIQIKAWSRAHSPNFSLKPVLEWKSRIGQIKRVPKGASIGYAGTWRASKVSLIATIPVGYSDGYDRSWSNRAWVMIRSHKAPVVGRVSMNLLMVDVTHVPKVKRDETVTLLGQDISADQLSALVSGTINYEVTATIHPNIPRLIV